MQRDARHHETDCIRGIYVVVVVRCTHNSQDRQLKKNDKKEIVKI
jgi:hypothetical protein